MMKPALSTVFLSLSWGMIVTALPVHRTPVTQDTPSPQNRFTKESCLEVAGRGSGLYVRSQPTVESKAIAVLADGQEVALVDTTPIGNGWLPIMAPVEGYVFAGFLRPCGRGETGVA